MPTNPIIPIAVRYEILNSPTATTPAAILKPKVPPAGTAPVVEWSGSNRIGRTLSGLHVEPAEAAKLTAGLTWIRVVHNDRSVGVFRYLGAVEEELVTGTSIAIDPCPDRTHHLDVELLDPVDCEVGELFTNFLVELYGLAGFAENELDIEPSVAACGSLLTFANGGPHIIEIAVQIHALLGYLPPHLNRDGRPQVRAVPSPALLRPSMTYAPGAASRIKNGSVRTSTSMSNSPNIYTGRSTSPSGTPVEARYRIPADAPNSVEHAGFPNPRTVDVSGAADDTQALEVLKAQARIDGQVVRTVEFASTPNTDHDAWDVVGWKDERMLEHAWSLPLGPGDMSHVLRTAYADG